MTVFNCQTCQYKRIDFDLRPICTYVNSINYDIQNYDIQRLCFFVENCPYYKCTYTCKDCAHYSKPSTIHCIPDPFYINGHLMNICESFKKTHKKKSSLNKAKLKYCANCKFYHIYSSICVCTQSEHYRCKVTSGRCKCNTHEFKTSKSRTLVRLPARQLIVL